MRTKLLKEISLFVRTLGRTETGKRTRPVAITNLLEARRGAFHCLVPGGLTEMRPRIRGVDQVVGGFFDAVLAHHRLGQALRVADVVETETALHTQPILVGRAVAARHIQKLVVFDVVRELAPDAAIRTHALHFAVGVLRTCIFVINQCRRHQCAGRARLHTLAASDARGLAHRIVKIENDFLVMAAAGHADHVVDLHFAAGADAKIALDAGIEINRHSRMAAIGRRRAVSGESAGTDTHAVGPGPKFRLRVVRGGLAVRLVRNKKLEHHLPRRFGAVRCRLHLHAFTRLANAARGQNALTFDLDHAGAAIAVGAIAGLGGIAKMWDVGAKTLCNLPYGLAVERLDFFTVEDEFHRCGFAVTCGHCICLFVTSFPAASTVLPENILSHTAADLARLARGHRWRHRAWRPTVLPAASHPKGLWP